MASWIDIVRRLAARRAELMHEVNRIDNLMNAVKELQKVLPDQEAPAFLDRSMADVLGTDPAQPLITGLVTDVPSDIAYPPRTGPRERNIVSPADIAAFARETLLEARRPMKRGELVRAIEARGLPLAGGDKAKNLGTILWRHDDMFVNLDKLGYWPRDVRLEGVHEPEAVKRN